MRDLGNVRESFRMVLRIAHPILIGRPAPILVWILIVCLTPPYWVDDGVQAVRTSVSFQFFVCSFMRIVYLEPVLRTVSEDSARRLFRAIPTPRRWRFLDYLL